MPVNRGVVVAVNINADGVAGFKPEPQKFFYNFLMSVNVPGVAWVSFLNPTR